jgi:hypothetical protein
MKLKISWPNHNQIKHALVHYKQLKKIFQKYIMAWQKKGFESLLSFEATQDAVRY